MSWRKLVKFKLTYFKPSGKYYSEGEEEFDCRLCQDGNTVYMPDYVGRIRGLRRNAGQGAHLPGLNSLWLNGYVLIDCEDGVPCLLLPELSSQPVPDNTLE